MREESQLSMEIMLSLFKLYTINSALSRIFVDKALYVW